MLYRFAVGFRRIFQPSKPTGVKNPEHVTDRRRRVLDHGYALNFQCRTPLVWFVFHYYYSKIISFEYLNPLRSRQA